MNSYLILEVWHGNRYRPVNKWKNTEYGKERARIAFNKAYWRRYTRRLVRREDTVLFHDTKKAGLLR